MCGIGHKQFKLLLAGRRTVLHIVHVLQGSTYTRTQQYYTTTHIDTLHTSVPNLRTAGQLGHPRRRAARAPGALLGQGRVVCVCARGTGISEYLRLKCGCC